MSNPNTKSPKNPLNFICEQCDYTTSNKKDFNKHEGTQKHKNKCNPNNSYDKNPFAGFDCKCGKVYKHCSTLSAHKKKCNLINEGEISNINILVEPLESETIEKKGEDIIDILINENKDFKNIILDLVKTNTDLQKQMMEVCKNGIINNTTINANNTNNSHNKTFNLQFFLNEQCKDAMNIMDFVNTFQLQLSDLERIGEVGYVEGISTIVIDKLNQMDVYKRPIHCSDAKRETMHVKDNDVWVKDASANDKIRLALKHITKKNTDMIRPWLNAHPGVLNSEHRLNDKYQEMFIEAMGGRKNKNMKEGEDKIIKKICKMVLIDKNM
jgi:hypothetical protein